MTDELRKLAEAAIDAYTRINLDDENFDVGSQADIDAVNAFDAAASPDAVLALLDRIEELGASNRYKYGDGYEAASIALIGERDEARAAVKRLAGALDEILMGRPRKNGEVDPQYWAYEALDDPVVKRIVEE